MHRSNVTGVSPLSYEIDADGGFLSRYADAAATKDAATWTRYFATTANMRVRPLVEASAAGISRAVRNKSVGAALIAATLTEAASLRFSGYVIQVNGPGSDPSDRAQWTAFLASWLDAFSSAGIDLGITIRGSCEPSDAPEAFNMTCADYNGLALNRTSPHPNLRVISRATFTSVPSDWTGAVDSVHRVLGPSIAELGVQYNAPLTDPSNGCLTYALAGGLAVLYVWEGVPSGAAAEAAWDSFGFWLNDVF
jgi:hypothetical protein